MFSTASLNRLNSCDPRLRVLFSEVIKFFDCTVLCGHRSKEKQDAAYKKGNSKLKYPQSKHNKKPSLAVDVAPYINGSVSFDRSQCYYFAGVVRGIACKIGFDHHLRWGGDWDSDHDINDQTFKDLVHFEII